MPQAEQILLQEQNKNPSDNAVCVLIDCCLLSGFEQQRSQPAAWEFNMIFWKMMTEYLESVVHCVKDTVCLFHIILCLTLQLIQDLSQIIKATFVLQGGSFL